MQVERQGKRLARGIHSLNLGYFYQTFRLLVSSHHERPSAPDPKPIGSVRCSSHLSPPSPSQDRLPHALQDSRPTLSKTLGLTFSYEPPPPVPLTKTPLFPGDPLTLAQDSFGLWALLVHLPQARGCCYALPRLPYKEPCLEAPVV